MGAHRLAPVLATGLAFGLRSSVPNGEGTCKYNKLLPWGEQQACGVNRGRPPALCPCRIGSPLGLMVVPKGGGTHSD
jgi:hypothetical protein